MALSAGDRLGPYEILEPLGAGGMGEVYRAHDTKLDRDVALKVLPDGALEDEGAKGRFRREAKALSRLSHPHIATLFDSDDADGTAFLVMELVRGPSLRDELEDKGALPEKDVIRLGTQLARGLQAAHEQGIVHRDLKPANLQLTPDGLLKVLDFGLARLAPTAPSPGEDPGPTQTAVGRVAGTLPYMSPEQLRGRGVDARTDLYSAGAVLYEMATGKRPFSKPSSSELTAAILNEDPTPPRDLNARISTGLEAVILKALDKDPELRYQTAKELLVDLERLQLRAGSVPSGAVSVPPSATPPRGARTRRRPLVAAAVAVAALAGGFWILWPNPLPRIVDVQPLRVDLGPAFSEFIKPTWTTDGQRLYFVAREEGVYRLYQVPLAGGERAEIETPFGRGLELHGFVQSRSALLVRGQLEPIGSRGAGPTIWLVPVPTGTPQPVGQVRGHTAALSPDERTIAVGRADTMGQRGQIALTGLDGSDPRVMLEGPRVPEWLQWSPDGSRLRFVAVGPEGHEGEGWLWETSSQGARPRPLWPGQRGDWTTDGQYFVFERPHVSETWLGIHSGARSDIYVVPERPRWPWARAQPIRLTTGPLSFSHVGPRPDGRGLLAFGTTPKGELQRFDRRTGRLEPFLGGESVGMVRPSPDGEWLAWVSFPESQLWRGRRDGTERLRLTRPSQHAFMPSWSPDGARIAFVGDAPGDPRLGLHTVSADGGATETVAAPRGRLGFWDNCWTPGGDSILFSELASEGLGIWRIELATESVNVLPGAERMAGIKCGPQGQLLALGAVDGGSRLGLLVRGSDADAWEPIPFDFRNVYPTWTRDGRAVCGLRSDGRVGCYSFATARMETVVDLGDTPLLTWVFVPWFGLDADDNPLIMIDRSTRDLYSIDWEVS